MQALKLPGLVMSIVKKFAKLPVDPKKLLVEYGLTSSGINIKQKQDVII